MVSPVSIGAVALVITLVAFAWWRKIPVVMALTIGNLLVFVLIATTGRSLTLEGSQMVDDLAARVEYITDPNLPRLYTILTATILHANLAHVVGNMLILMMIGVPFEDRVGRARFLSIYVVSAVTAVLIHALWIVTQGTPAELSIPLVGASGAVFGILGAFATMYPRDQIPVFLLFIVLPRVPVWVAAVVYTAMEGFLLFGAQGGSIARAAHVGGAFGGFLLGLLLRQRAPPEHMQATPTKIDYGALERLATAPAQKTLLQKLRENEDQRETQRAWLERLLPTLQCPQCSRTLTPHRRGTLTCENGHEEIRYAR